jgi:hypothetical protein
VASGGVGQGGPALGDPLQKFQAIDVGWSYTCYCFGRPVRLLLYSLVWLSMPVLMFRPNSTRPPSVLSSVVVFLELNPILESRCILSCLYSSHISVDSRVTADYLVSAQLRLILDNNFLETIAMYIRFKNQLSTVNVAIVSHYSVEYSYCGLRFSRHPSTPSMEPILTQVPPIYWHLKASLPR